MIRLATGCFLVLLCCTPGCGKRHVQIDRETRRTIDTTAARQIYVLRPELDSLCQLKTDSMVRVMSDSILEVRRSEIRKLLGK